MQKITGTVKRTRFESDAFTVGTLQINERESIQFTLKAQVKPGDVVTLEGDNERTKWGLQFVAQSYTFAMPFDAAGICAYIAKNKAIKNIGPKRAEILAATFGANWDFSLENEGARMAKLARVSLADIACLRDEWKRTTLYNQASVYLAGLGCSFGEIQRIVKRYEQNTVRTVKETPYALIGEIRGFGFRRVDGIARKAGIGEASPSRIMAAIRATLDEQSDAGGHTWTWRGDLIKATVTLLASDKIDMTPQVASNLNTMIERGLLYDDGAGRTGVCDLRDAELAIERAIATLRERNKPHADALYMALGATSHDALNNGQKDALAASLVHSALVVSGSAGTGKTFLVKSICDVYERAGLRTILCAPTGKAAKRLAEKTNREASTIHKLLKYDGTRFKFFDDFAQYLDCDMLICDEFSMVDVHLARNLLRALNHARTSVVFVGDPNQLPPVGAGNVLRDLIVTGACKHVKLSQVVRQGGALLENCNAVLQGIVPNSCGESWQVERGLVDTFDVEKRLVYLYWLACESKNDLPQILTPARRDMALSVNNLNRELQRIYQEARLETDVTKYPGRKFFHFDRVIQRKNNYDLCVMNGAIGTIEEIDGDEMRVRFDDDGSVVKFSRKDGDWQDLDLAFALTVHQVQGSEFDNVVFICHKSHSFQHHRALFYTAVTRAKRSVTILGDTWGIRNCAQKEESAKRRTWLSLV